MGLKAVENGEKNIIKEHYVRNLEKQLVLFIHSAIFYDLMLTYLQTWFDMQNHYLETFTNEI